MNFQKNCNDKFERGDKIFSMANTNSTSAWVRIERKDSVLLIKGGGSWIATQIHEIDEPLRAIDAKSIKSLVLDLNDVTDFDTSGSWVIERLIRSLKRNKVKYDIKTRDETLLAILEQIEKFDYDRPVDFTPPSPLKNWVEEVGVAARKASVETYRITEFLGHLTVVLFRCLRHPSKLRWVSIVSTFNRVGLNAVPIVSLIAFFIGVVLVYQGSSQLKQFGAEIYTVNLLGISLLREIGILLTAILVAGRSGSAFAAQIGTMKLNQEVDALQTFGLDPMEVLVVPRVIALVVALPILTFIADIIGLAGGAIMSYTSLEISFRQYITQLNGSFSPSSFWVGIGKAPIFGFLIAMVGCYEGMQVQGGSLSVGKKTTRAVVTSIFLVILMDAVFSVLFTKLEW